ncbi:hypothetical protein FA13DRAFT_1800006 [Coprinellus micaceus]|uniref:DUF6533 domain-containing protein n=1 Tax=Coprinellus micaceus TaxID=71717 RepID=A0A4Y7SHL1_COPMI|nr:hypothetical protein FA13DRAFT_1800006 [Coprinellus micaceus]
MRRPPPPAVYTTVASYCLYVYYVLTTTAEEVSIIFPQRWSRGKLLYATIRYRTLLQIALQFSRDYRNYFSISPMSCKALHIIFTAIGDLAYLACDFSLSLCLSALLQAKPMYLIGIVLLSCGIPFANALFNLVAQFQYPPEPVSLINVELGYPCYMLSEEGWEKTMLNAGRNVRAYVNLVSTAILALLGIVTLVTRYRGKGGRLVQVIRRDGRIHYLSLLVIRVVSAIIWTPAVIPMPELDPNPVYLVLNMANYVLIPILAQRLLVNMRKVDYMGSEPVASKLLFALPAPGSEDNLGNDFDSLEMTQEPSGLRQPGSAGGAKRREVGVRSSSV